MDQSTPSTQSYVVDGVSWEHVLNVDAPNSTVAFYISDSNEIDIVQFNDVEESIATRMSERDAKELYRILGERIEKGQSP